MNGYKVTIDLSTEQFITLLASGTITIQANEDSNKEKLGTEIPIRTAAEPLARRKPKIPNVDVGTFASEPRQRKKRGSKVNDTILGKLQQGGQTHKNDLEQALADAGLAVSSLSTGLALLQKSGQIKRLGNGMYGLAEAA